MWKSIGCRHLKGILDAFKMPLRCLIKCRHPRCLYDALTVVAKGVSNVFISAKYMKITRATKIATRGHHNDAARIRRTDKILHQGYIYRSINLGLYSTSKMVLYMTRIIVATVTTRSRINPSVPLLNVRISGHFIRL